MEGINPAPNEIEIRNPDAYEPLAALAFKVATDPYVGRLVFLRVYSGTVKAGAVVNNVTKNGRERMGRLLRMHANSREELEEVTAGNICAAIGLKNTFTGDTIGSDIKTAGDHPGAAQIPQTGCFSGRLSRTPKPTKTA